MAGPVSFVTSWAVAGALRPRYDPVEDAISRLAEVGADHRWIVTAGMITFGVSALGFSATCHTRGGMRLSAASLAVAGAASIAVGVFPCTQGCPDSEAFTDVAHAVSAGVFYVSFVAAPLAASVTAPRPAWRRASLAAGLVAGAALAVHVSIDQYNGFWQRMGLTTGDVWMAGLALALMSRDAPRNG